MKTFNFKRLVSVATVICMLAILFVPMATATVSAETAGVNMLVNPNFDNGLTGWTGGTHKTSSGEHGSASVQLDAWGNTTQMITLEAGVTYSYGFFADGSALNAKILIQTNSPFGTDGLANPVKTITGTAQYVTGTFTADVTANHFFTVYSYANGAYFDSFYVVEGTDTSVAENKGNLITNPNFDSGVTGWTGGEHKANRGEHDSASVKLDAWGNTLKMVTLKAGKTYSYGFYADGNALNFNVYFQSTNPWNDGRAYPVKTITGTSQYVTGTITADVTKSYFFMIYSNVGESYFDSFYVVEGTDLSVLGKSANLFANPDFDNGLTGWTGGTHKTSSGEHGSASVQLDAWGNTMKMVTLEAGKTYSYGFYANGNALNFNVYFQSTNPWNDGRAYPVKTITGTSQYVTGTITADVTGSYFFMIYSNVGESYFDSFYVVEGTDLSVLEKKTNLVTEPYNNGVVLESWGSMYQGVTLKANTSYTFGFHVSVENSKEAARFFIFAPGANIWDTAAEPVWTLSNAESQYVTGTFTAPATGNYTLMLKEWGGDHKAVYDSFFVEELYAGDVNCDKTVADTEDMVTLRKILIGAVDAASEITADLTGDGKVDILDLIRIKRQLAN